MSELQALVDNAQLPDELGFGRLMVPVMFKAEYIDGLWSTGELIPYQGITLDPAAKVLHYAQEIFEGMKAYWVDSPQPQLFRPLDNCRRFNRSAQALCMPEVPEALFMEGVSGLTRLCSPLIPRQRGASLYLRPFMIGTEADLTLGASSRYEFYVIASPSEIYHAGGMRVLVERERSRTAAGGMGAAKTGGNYAAAMETSKACVQKGYNQVLWLNSAVEGQIDELSGMNLFVVIDGELHTPRLNGSILEGITRDSVINMARKTGLTVHERDINIDELLGQIESGQCTEAFACGTAAVISPICLVADQGAEYQLPQEQGPVATQLHETLLGMQEGRQPDDLGWIVTV